jgi:DNA mismatch repair ATPase MutS
MDATRLEEIQKLLDAGDFFPREHGMIRDLRAALDAANKRAEAGATELSAWKSAFGNPQLDHAITECDRLHRAVNDWTVACHVAEEERDRANKRAEAANTGWQKSIQWHHEKEEALGKAEQERDRLRERARHDAADIATLGRTCDNLRAEVERLKLESQMPWKAIHKNTLVKLLNAENRLAELEAAVRFAIDGIESAWEYEEVEGIAKDLKNALAKEAR